MLRSWWSKKGQVPAVKPETKGQSLVRELGNLYKRFEDLLEDVAYESKAALDSADMKPDQQDGSLVGFQLKERMAHSFNSHSDIGYQHIIKMKTIVEDITRKLEDVRQEVIPREHAALEQKYSVTDMWQRLNDAKQVHDQAIIAFVQKQPDVVSPALRMRVDELTAA